MASGCATVVLSRENSLFPRSGIRLLNSRGTSSTGCFQANVIINSQPFFFSISIVSNVAYIASMKKISSCLGKYFLMRCAKHTAACACFLHCPPLPFTFPVMSLGTGKDLCAMGCNPFCDCPVTFADFCLKLFQRQSLKHGGLTGFGEIGGLH